MKIHPEDVAKLKGCDEDEAKLLDPPDSTENLVTPELKSEAGHEDKTSSVVEVSNELLNITDSKNHRRNADYSSESSDDSETDEFFRNLHKNIVPSQLPIMRTKGELLIEDLPPVEDLDLNVDATELQKMGKVLHSVISEDRNEYLVVVESDRNSSPIAEDSVLFLESDKPLGKIYDVFGSIHKPKYTIRFNKSKDITDKGVAPGQVVYYLPGNNELTRYVLVNELKLQKGSDASWKDNNEPPDDQIDYSDDEQEKLAKQKRKAKNRRNDRNWNDAEEDNVPNKIERRNVTYNQEKAFNARSPRNNFPSQASRAPRPSPQRYNHTPPRFDSPSPGPSGLHSNVVSPRPFEITFPNNRVPFIPRSMPAPQTYNPFSLVTAPPTRPFGNSLQNRDLPYPHFAASPTPVSASSSFVTVHPPSSPMMAAAHQTYNPFAFVHKTAPQPFGTSLQNRESSYPRFAASPTPNVSASPNFVTVLPTSSPMLVAAPQAYKPFSVDNVRPPRLFETYGQSRPRLPQHFTASSTPNVLASPSFVTAPPPTFNAPTSSSFITVPPPQISSPMMAAAPQPFNTFSSGSAPAPRTFATFQQSRELPYPHFAASPTPNISALPNFATVPPPQNQSFHMMAAHQNNIPLQHHQQQMFQKY